MIEAPGLNDESSVVKSPGVGITKHGSVDMEEAKIDDTVVNVKV